MADVILIRLLIAVPLLMMFEQPTGPVIVDITEPESSDLNGLADVLWGSLGLTGVLLLGSVLAAFLFAEILFWLRSRAD